MVIFAYNKLWTRSKFIATVGSLSLETVKEYIKSQKTNEQRKKY